jgi:DNA-binding NarL/FixJ family response regulator
MDMELLTVNKIKVLIADDHRVVREGLIVMLQSTGECEVIGQASTGEEAVLLAHKLQPDVAIVDLQMPGMGGIEAIQRITQQTPKVKVIVLSTFDQDEYIYQSVHAGAKGYVLKGSGLDELLDVVRSAATGKLLLSSDIATKLIGHISTPDLGLTLTDREHEVLRFLSRGWRIERLPNISVFLNVPSKITSPILSPNLALKAGRKPYHKLSKKA